MTDPIVWRPRFGEYNNQDMQKDKFYVLKVFIRSPDLYIQ